MNRFHNDDNHGDDHAMIIMTIIENGGIQDLNRFHDDDNHDDDPRLEQVIMMKTLGDDIMIMLMMIMTIIKMVGSKT